MRISFSPIFESVSLSLALYTTGALPGHRPVGREPNFPTEGIYVTESSLNHIMYIFTSNNLRELLLYSVKEALLYQNVLSWFFTYIFF